MAGRRAWQGGMHGGGHAGLRGMSGRGHMWQGACLVGGVHARGSLCEGLAWQGDVHGRGCAWQGSMGGREACMVGGMYGRGHAQWGNTCVVGSCVVCMVRGINGRKNGNCSGQCTSYWKHSCCSVCLAVAIYFSCICHATIKKRLNVTSKLTQHVQEGSDIINHFLLTTEACSQLTHQVIGFYDVYCIATVVAVTERCTASMRRYDVTFNHCVVSKTFVPKQFEFLATWKSQILL